MRIYDTRLGRFLSVDPITQEYPELTPYQFASNRPIDGIDRDGLEHTPAILREGVGTRDQTAVNTKPKLWNKPPTISAYDPNVKSWKAKWRDSDNILANITYDIANGLYTLPQQLTASARDETYIYNIGGNVHRAHGIEGEKERTKNFINGATTLVPSSQIEKGGQKLFTKLLNSKYADDILTKVENAVTEHINKLTRQSVDDKLSKYLLNPSHPVGGAKANWFEKALGFTQENASQLADQIVFDGRKAFQTAVTEFGTKFNQVIPIKGANGKLIDVTFSWIRNNDGIYRLVTAIPTKLK